MEVRNATLPVLTFTSQSAIHPQRRRHYAEWSRVGHSGNSTAFADIRAIASIISL